MSTRIKKWKLKGKTSKSKKSMKALLKTLPDTLKLKFLQIVHSGEVSSLKKSSSSLVNTDLSDNGFTMSSLKSCQLKGPRRLPTNKIDTMITQSFSETNLFKNARAQVHSSLEQVPWDVNSSRCSL